MRMGGGVSHSTDLMLTYQRGALEGSPAYAATCACGRLITVSVSTSTRIAEPLVFVQTPAQAIEHRVPSPPMPAGSVIGQSRMDEPQVSETVTGGMKLDSDDARHVTGVGRNPGEDEAVRRLDFQVFTGVFDHATLALHHDAEPAADAEVDVGFDGADGGHPLPQQLGIRPPAEYFSDRGGQAAVDLDHTRVDHRRFLARSLASRRARRSSQNCR